MQGDNLTVVVGNTPHTINKTHMTYQLVCDAIKKGEWDKVKDLVEPKKVVLNYAKGNVTINDGEIFWRNKPMHNALADRMLAMLKEGFSIDPMVNFMDNLMNNPSNRAVTELYGFLETGSMPITPDGCFLAYKKVLGSYMDVHSNSVLNKPAHLMTADERATVMGKQVGRNQEVAVAIVNDETVISMMRNQVNDDKDQTCSAGLHFCSQDYLRNFSGERVVILKINPRDVVSIPSDYSSTKGRTCAYTVIGEVSGEVRDSTEFTKSVQSTANSLKPVAPLNPAAAWPFPSGVKAKGPKTGKTPFYRGYSDGFNGAPSDEDYDWNIDYLEGYEKGQLDDELGNSTPRYKFVN